MKTEVKRSDHTLTIITTADNDYRMHDGYRDMARVYHQSRAGQALEDAIQAGARYYEPEMACTMYFDSMTAKSNTVVLCTAFRMRFSEDDHANNA